MPETKPATSPNPRSAAARQQLAEAILKVTEAAARARDEAAPVRRFNTIISHAALTAAEVAALRHADDEALAAWLVAGEAGPRPEPSPALVRAEKKAAAAERDARAAETALVRAAERERAANDALRRAGVERDEALFGVLRDEVTRLGIVLAQRFQAAVDLEAELASLAEALVQLANGRETDDAVAGGARNVVDVIVATRKTARGAEKQGSVENAKRFLDRLTADPGAIFMAEAV